MNQPVAVPPIPASGKPRRFWWRAIAISVPILIALIGGFWGYSVWSMRAAWAEAEAEAALDLPRWQLLELEADRPDIPDAENSALFMMALRKNGRAVSVSGAANYEKIFENLPPTAQLNKQQSDLIRTRLAIGRKAVDEARKLKDMPRGRFPITYSDDAISTVMPDHQNARGVAEWLQHDAYLLAHDEEMSQAVGSCQAILVASRAFERDLTLIALLIRLAMQNISILTLERVLAQGEAPEASLQALQAALQRETKADGFLQGVRGERALIHHLFTNIRDGKIESGWLRIMGGGSGANPVQSAQLWVADRWPSVSLKYYPEYLRHMNRCVATAMLPIHERAAKLKDWEDDCRKTSNPVIRMLAPAISKCHIAEARTQAMVRSALASLACERYRLKHKSWPESLDVLVKENLIEAVPTDPMDGQPIRYRRTKEGIVVYSIGFDKIDNQGNVDRDRIYEPGVDIGFRLWHPVRRRQVALPPVAFAEGEPGQ